MSATRVAAEKGGGSSVCNASIFIGGKQMLIIYVAALLGIFRFRGREYWKWFGILFVWMLAAQLLFAGGGTLENPSGDGLIAHQIRVATNDGPGMGIFAIVFIMLYWGGAIWLLRKMWLVGKKLEEEQLDREAETGEEVGFERKVGETVLATVLAAIYIYVAFILPRTAAETAPVPVDSSQAETDVDPIAAELSEAASEASREAPKKIDQITTLERVTAEGRQLTYHYRLSRRDATDEQLRKFVREHGVVSACKNPDMFRAMKDYQVTYRYSYTLPNAAEPVFVDATFSDCQILGVSS